MLFAVATYHPPSVVSGCIHPRNIILSRGNREAHLVKLRTAGSCTRCISRRIQLRLAQCRIPIENQRFDSVINKGAAFALEPRFYLIRPGARRKLERGEKETGTCEGRGEIPTVLRSRSSVKGSAASINPVPIERTLRNSLGESTVSFNRDAILKVE